VSAMPSRLLPTEREGEGVPASKAPRVGMTGCSNARETPSDKERGRRANIGERSRSPEIDLSERRIIGVREGIIGRR
jgi:hypothetical protein